MPTNVIDAIECQINKRSGFEEHQNKRLETLLKILKSKNENDKDEECKNIVEKLKAVGILDNNCELSPNYKG